MRQAGRYLPEYRALRLQHRLRDLFFTPDLLVEVTKMPLKRWNLDAAILFSDITVVVEALGFSLDFVEGPQVREEVVLGQEFPFLPERLLPILEGVEILRKDLSLPLLGFCGAPFTVATYLMGGIPKTKQAVEDPRFPALLESLERATIWYIQEQIARGVDAIQIFESWANHLSPREFFLYSLPYLKRIAAASSVPVLIFGRGIHHFVEHLPFGLSVDWEADMSSLRQKTAFPLQGNLDPEALFLPLPLLEEKIDALLQRMQGDRAFICNLGHGIRPHTPLEAVDLLVEKVHAC